jgi:hypothetical protein
LFAQPIHILLSNLLLEETLAQKTTCLPPFSPLLPPLPPPTTRHRPNAFQKVRRRLLHRLKIEHQKVPPLPLTSMSPHYKRLGFKKRRRPNAKGKPWSVLILPYLATWSVGSHFSIFNTPFFKEIAFNTAY